MRRCTGPYLSHACNTGRARRSISFDICRCAFRIAERLRWGQISIFSGGPPGRKSRSDPLPVAEPGPVTENPRTRMSGYRGYVELVRPANVATALADVLAGYAVAGQGDPRLNPSLLAWLLLSTACLYAGGVVLNDVFDRDLDRIERPERPIPSGRVSTTAAAGLGSGLLAAGILAATLATRRCRDRCRGDGCLRPALRRLGETAGAARAGEHGIVPGAQPVAWDCGGP